jgi:hypothetical protein
VCVCVFVFVFVCVKDPILLRMIKVQKDPILLRMIKVLSGMTKGSDLLLSFLKDRNWGSPGDKRREETALGP